MRPIVNGLQKEFQGQIAFDFIDVAAETGGTMFKAYRLRGHPSYVIVDEFGNPLWSFSGQITEDVLRAKIQNIAVR